MDGFGMLRAAQAVLFPRCLVQCPSARRPSRLRPGRASRSRLRDSLMHSFASAQAVDVCDAVAVDEAAADLFDEMCNEGRKSTKVRLFVLSASSCPSTHD